MNLNRSYNFKDVLTRASITIQIIEDVAIYKAQLYSSNGNIFGSRDKETDLSVKVYKGLDDITAKFSDIVWRRFTTDSGDLIEDIKWGEQHKNKTDIVVTREDINYKANIQVEVYSIINKERTLVAADFISFIDVNDMQGSTTPPENPKHGDLWLDTSVTPPRLMMWDANLGMWVEVKIAGQDRRNLILNSNFFRKDFTAWDVVGAPDLEIESFSAKKWARIKTEYPINDYNGISQRCIGTPKADYSFQILAGTYIQSVAPKGNIVCAFFSIDKNNKRILIKEETFDITDKNKVFTTTFVSLNETENIDIIVSGEIGQKFDFVCTNMKLENHKIPTAWELALEDVQDALDMKVGNTAEEVFDSLTDGGKMQGIYVDVDEHGNKNYYVSGRYIDAKNLRVRRESDGADTLRIDETGNVYLKAKTLQIVGDAGQWEDAATESDIAWKIDIISSNGIVFKNKIINTTLSAKVYKGKKEMTEELPASKFKWYRTSTNNKRDLKWNDEEGIGVKEIHITSEDIYQRATFTCEITE